MLRVGMRAETLRVGLPWDAERLDMHYHAGAWQREGVRTVTIQVLPVLSPAKVRLICQEDAKDERSKIDFGANSYICCRDW